MDEVPLIDPDCPAAAPDVDDFASVRVLGLLRASAAVEVVEIASAFGSEGESGLVLFFAVTTVALVGLAELTKRPPPDFDEKNEE